MKPVTKALLIAQELDFLTTFYGIYILQLRELNPLGLELAMVFKLFVLAFAVVCLERVRCWPPLVWALPLISFLPVFWNLLNILAA